jgi:hypothetical protein
MNVPSEDIDKEKGSNIAESKTECHTHRLRNQYVSFLWKFNFLNLAFDNLLRRTAAFENLRVKCYLKDYRSKRHKTHRDSLSQRWVPRN